MSAWRTLHNAAASGNSKHPGTANKGLGRTLKQLKRAEAEERNSKTPHNRTRAHRVGRCECES